MRQWASPACAYSKTSAQPEANLSVCVGLPQQVDVVGCFNFCRFNSFVKAAVAVIARLALPTVSSFREGW